MDLQRQLRIARAWLPLILGSIIVAGVAGFLVSNLQPKVYEARATLVVGGLLTGVNPDYNQLLVSQQLSHTYATITTTRPVLSSVIDQLQLSVTPEELARRIQASTEADSTLLNIAARDVAPGQAAAIANAIAQELINVSPAVQGQQTEVLQSIDQDLEAIRAEIRQAQSESEQLSAVQDRTPAQEARLQTLQGRLGSLRSTFATLLSFSGSNASNVLTVIQPAVSPIQPVEPRPLLTGALAALVGFLIASGIAFAAEYLDDAIKTAEQVQEVVGLPTLATVVRMKSAQDRPTMYRLATLLYPRSIAAESYRTLRTNVEFMAMDAPIRTLLVTSAVPSEGKTVTAANLAVVFAQGGRRVLLVDADLRKPGVHEILSLPNSMGLTSLLRREGAAVTDVVVPSEQERLDVLTTGPIPPNPAELLGSQRMKGLVTSLAESYDLLIFDSPPLEAFTDSAVLSSFLDGTILVIGAKRGHRALVRRAREALAKANANVVGAVINGLPENSRVEFGSYYGVGTDASGPAAGSDPRGSDIDGPGQSDVSRRGSREGERLITGIDPK